jgi:hypothetical protein
MNTTAGKGRVEDVARIPSPFYSCCVLFQQLTVLFMLITMIRINCRSMRFRVDIHAPCVVTLQLLNEPEE